MFDQPSQPSLASESTHHPDSSPAAARKHPELRVAVSSSASGQRPVWAWAATLVLILAGGLTLYSLRSALTPILDRWIPVSRQAVEEVPAERPEPVFESPPEVEAPSEPQWTWAEIEAAIMPLPERTHVLIIEGRGELSQFKKLDSVDEALALPARNRWRLWRRIWRNRVAQIRGQLPPQEACQLHAELLPTCRALETSLAILDRLPAAQTLDAARAAFDAAAWVLDTYEGPPRKAPRRHR